MFGPCLLRPNGWMDQYASWYGGRPRPRRHCVRWGHCSPLPKKGADPLSPILGPCLLWPNSWMDQDATWHGGGPWTRPHRAGWGSSSPPEKWGLCPVQFSAHFHCGQTAGCIKMPLGMDVGLSQGDFVFLGDPTPLPKRDGALNFTATSIVAKRLHGLRCHLVRR